MCEELVAIYLALEAVLGPPHLGQPQPTYEYQAMAGTIDKLRDCSHQQPWAALSQEGQEALERVWGAQR